MNLLDIGKKIIGMGLPMLGTALGGPAGGIVGGLIGHALGIGDKPSAEQISQAIDGDPQAAKIKLQQVEADHAEAMARIQALQVQAQQTGQTMRVEYGSTDPYVRRWRPTWGYVSAGAWAFEALAIGAGLIGGTVAALTGHTSEAQILLAAMPAIIGAMAALWSIALAVLGVSVRARSRDKAVQAGQDPGPSLIDALIQRVSGSGKPSVAASSGDGSGTADKPAGSEARAAPVSVG